ncbi:MAG: ABC transporter ATP-binding protein [Chthonomonadales bacterium]
MATSATTLSFENVSFQFGKTTRGLAALQNISFDMMPGDVVALVGESGCGKSTLLNIAAGFLLPTTGNVRFQGEAVRRPSPNRAVIFQDSGLMPWLSAKGNIELALRDIRDKRLRSEKADQALQSVGLSQFAKMRPHQLSGGMRQRVSIARALAMDSDLLLMDEPFAALDAITRDTLLQEMKSLLAEFGKSALLVTHSAAEAAYLANRVFCMGGRPGEIVDTIECDLPQEMQMDNPDLRRTVSRIQAILRNSHNGFETQENENGQKIAHNGAARGMVAGGCVGDFLGDRSAA